MRKPPRLPADAELLRQIGKRSLLDAIDIASCLALLREGADFLERAHFERPPTAKTGVLVQKALVERVLIFVVRAYAPVRKGDQHTRKAFDLLAKANVLEEVAAVGARPYLEQAIHVWDRMDGSPRFRRLKHYRDKVVAHSGERDPEIPVPLVNELVSFAHTMTDVWVRLAKGVGVVGLDFDLNSQVKIHEQPARALWGALAANRGMVGSDKAAAPPRERGTSG